MNKIIPFIIILVFVAGCQEYKEKEKEYDKSQINEEFLLKLPNGSIDQDECHQSMYSLYSKLYGSTQRMIINVRTHEANTYEQAFKTGYCFDVEYIPEKTEVFKKYYPNYDLMERQFIYKNNYQKTEKKLERFSDNDKLKVTVGNYTKEFQLGCSHRYFADVIINFSREETYNCIFKGEIKSRNNTYEQLQGQICESYEIYCGE